MLLLSSANDYGVLLGASSSELLGFHENALDPCYDSQLRSVRSSLCFSTH